MTAGNSNTIIPASGDGQFAETATVQLVPRLLDSFGYANPACDVYRFWEPGFPIETTGATVLPLLIRCPPTSTGDADGNSSSGSGTGSVMVFFGSFGPKGVVNFWLNKAELGLSGKARARDAESNATIDSVGGNWSLPIDKHSFRIVIVSG